MSAVVNPSNLGNSFSISLLNNIKSSRSLMVCFFFIIVVPPDENIFGQNCHLHVPPGINKYKYFPK